MVLLDGAASTRAQASAARALATRAGLVARDQVPEIGLVTVDLPKATTFGALAARLRQDPHVRSVQLEGRMELRSVPNDPALFSIEAAAGTPPGTHHQWWLERSGLYSAWDVARGAGALVGVIDLGADGNHPEIGPKIAAAVDQESSSETGPATYDGHGHGTHVASIACAASGNGIGIAGAGHDCRMIIEKSDLTDSSIANSIVDAANRGAHAINMSFGDTVARPPVEAISRAIDFALTKNVVLVAAAADEPVTEQGQPANLLQPTGTGADITQGKGLSITSAAFSDIGSGGGAGTQISMAAYGSFGRFGETAGPPGLLGAFPGNPALLEQGSLIPIQPGCGCRTVYNGDGRYAYLQGTSIAAPQVAAVGAMLRTFNPFATAPEIVRALKQSARRPAGAWTAELGWGILDAAGAVVIVRRIDHRQPVSRLRGPRSTRARAITLRWTGSDPAGRSGLIPSGIRHYEVWRYTGRSRPIRIARTTRRSLRVRTRPGTRFSYYTVAVDRAGNREARPRGADATVRAAQ